MAILMDTRYFSNISAQSQLTVSGLPQRGGIILEVNAVWHPFTFTNAGELSERPVGGDVLFKLESTAGISLTSVNQSQFNVVPQGGNFHWVHPYSNEIQDAATMIEKLASGNLNPRAIGLILESESLRYVFKPDPNRPLGVHSLEVNVTMLAFDTTSGI